MKKVTTIPPTPISKEEAALRAAIQKRNALIEGIVFNCIHGSGNALPAEEVVNYAIAVADDMMKKLYGLKKE